MNDPRLSHTCIDNDHVPCGACDAYLEPLMPQNGGCSRCGESEDFMANESHSCIDQPHLACSACLTPRQEVEAGRSRLGELFNKRAVTIAFRMGYRAAMEDFSHPDCATTEKINVRAAAILGDVFEV